MYIYNYKYYRMTYIVTISLIIKHYYFYVDSNLCFKCRKEEYFYYLF